MKSNAALEATLPLIDCLNAASKLIAARSGIVSKADGSRKLSFAGLEFAEGCDNAADLYMALIEDLQNPETEEFYEAAPWMPQGKQERVLSLAIRMLEDALKALANDETI